MPNTVFELIEFNRVRFSRGKEAAKMRVIEDGEVQGFLWMSPADIRANIKDFGSNDALVAALNAYGETL